MNRFNPQVIGQRIAKARKKLGLSQREVAEILGLERTSITNIEAGRQRMLLDKFCELAAILNVKPENLLK